MTKSLWLRLRVRALVGVLAFFIAAGLIGWLNEAYLLERWIIRPYMQTQFQPYVRTAEAERLLKPLDPFSECASDCPEMIVLPAGEFTMGSPGNDKGRYTNREGPQHKVTIARPFAVSKFELTFDQWDACVSNGDCHRRSDSGFGRGRQPVISVSWDDAQTYVTWLSRMTGRPYRLRSEAEWEYAARAGTQTAYSWGDEIGKGNANCGGCGSQWDKKQAAPVGSFAANAFGLYDMHGNVSEWVEDCFHDNYNGAPSDGSAWIAGECTYYRVVRGGNWNDNPENLRSADRGWDATGYQFIGIVGFRVGRTLTP